MNRFCCNVFPPLAIILIACSGCSRHKGVSDLELAHAELENRAFASAATLATSALVGNGYLAGPLVVRMSRKGDHSITVIFNAASGSSDSLVELRHSVSVSIEDWTFAITRDWPTNAKRPDDASQERAVVVATACVALRGYVGRVYTVTPKPVHVGESVYYSVVFGPEPGGRQDLADHLPVTVESNRATFGNM